MVTSIVIAFSTYSKIPMPNVEWSEKGMQYSLCFFPMVGIVIGLCSWGSFYVLQALGIGKAVVSAILCTVPILLTGGIHMDGFLDTVDARSSYQSKEEKLAILKDPHTGAFALLYGILYVILLFAFLQEVTKSEIASIALGYVYSRILSAFSVVTLKKAKKDGMAATYAERAKKQVKWILLGELILCLAAMCSISLLQGVLGILVGSVCYWYYKRMSYQTFGGITGDLAGWFLQSFELVFVIAIVLVGKVCGL